MTSTATGKVWTSAVIGLKAGQKYRCGALFKSQQGTVTFVAQPTSGSGGSPRRLVVKPGENDAAPQESEILADAQHPTLVVQIAGPLDAPEIVDKIWVTPAP